MERWHEDIRLGIDLERAVTTTEGYSFAEVEELKNLLIMRWLESGSGSGLGLAPVDVNGTTSTSDCAALVGFGHTEPVTNGQDRRTENG